MPKINHLLNDSQDKITYSFAKETRFPSINQPKGLDLSYDIQPPASKRSCNFGIGERPSLAKISPSPSPYRYNISSDFDKDPHKGIRFSLSRQQVKFGDPLYNKNVSPGPIYEIPSSVLIQSNGYMGIKLPTPRVQSLPGPGQYDLKCTSIGNDNYAISSIKNVGGMKHRFKTQISEVHRSASKNLGPGSYAEIDGINNTGVYKCAKYLNSKVKTFGRQKRKGIYNTKDTPGPGSYKLFSIFDD